MTMSELLHRWRGKRMWWVVLYLGLSVLNSIFVSRYNTMLGLVGLFALFCGLVGLSYVFGERDKANTGKQTTG
jgi:hypothetical protein